MALPARAVTAVVEIELVPGSGTWTDLSSSVTGLQITRPRPTSPSAGTAPTTCTVVLENKPDPVTGVCPFTPDSPVSPSYPNLTRDRRLRVTATWNNGANTSVRFNGWTDVFTPDFSGGVSEGTVTVSASCILSRYARRALRSDYGEAILARTDGPYDYWPLDEQSDATYVTGYTEGGVVQATGQIAQPAGNTGALAFGQPDSQILVDGSISLTRGETNAYSPVLVLPLRSGTPVFQVSAWIQLTDDPDGGTDDVIGMWDVAGDVIWRLEVHTLTATQNIEWIVTDGANVQYTFWSSGYSRDSAWHWISVGVFDAGGGVYTTELIVRDKALAERAVAGGFTGWPFDVRFGDYLVVGGKMPPRATGTQFNTVLGNISSLYVKYNSLGSGLSQYSAQAVVFTGHDRAVQLKGYGTDYDSIIGTPTGYNTTDTSPVMLTGANKDLLSAWNEHALSVGGLLSTRPDGRMNFDVEQNKWFMTVSMTVSAQTDLDAPTGGWTVIKDEQPTRATATSPAGTYTYIDTATEALTGMRLDAGSVACAAGDVNSVAQVASRMVSSTQGRLSGFGVDLATTSTDQTATFMGLLVGNRIRITDIPTGVHGVSYIDVQASGWTETYSAIDLTARWVFDTDASDDPGNAAWDGFNGAVADYGRFAIGTATVTGGTCVGTTGTGTVIITVAVGSPLTTTAGQYPMNLNWNGEVITVSGVGGGTSPQTATVTARGVAPSVARVHAAGEPIEVNLPFTFA